MKISEYAEKTIEDKVLYSCDEFSIHNESDNKFIRLKMNHGRILPFLKKNGIVDAIILNKESENLFSYPTQTLNQLSEAIAYCNANEWNVSEENFIHLGFWKSHPLLEQSECVWGLDINSLENSSNILSDTNSFIVPLSSINNIEDATTVAAILKLIIKIHTTSKEVE
ncbi:MAG: hypothetical protein RL348_17 [Bacteroidota bacterium]|jgi:hypothetical protein